MTFTIVMTSVYKFFDDVSPSTLMVGGGDASIQTSRKNRLDVCLALSFEHVRAVPGTFVLFLVSVIER